MKISKGRLEKMIGADKLKIVTESGYCFDCKQTTIVDYEKNIFINELGDTVLDGFCKKCKQPVSRYIETGEKPHAFLFDNCLICQGTKKAMKENKSLSEKELLELFKKANTSKSRNSKQ